MSINSQNTDSISKNTTQFFSSTITAILLIVTLIFIQIQFGHLFFHVIAELFSVFVGILMLVVIANTSSFIKNSFLMFLSISYFWLAILDVFHTFTFPGMVLSDNTHGQLTLQFWLYARLLESLVLLFSPFFLKRYLNGKLYFILSTVFCCTIIWISTSFKNPTLITEDGLTPIKIYTEYFVIFLLILSLLNYIRLRANFSPSIFKFLLISICFTIASEFSLTMYKDLDNLAVVVGHILKFLSFWLIYQAVIKTTLQRPFENLAQVNNSHNAIPHPSIIVNKEGEISQVNNSALELLDQSHQTINKKCIHIYFHPIDLKQDQCTFCKAIATGTILNQEKVYFPQYDKWYLLSLTPIKLREKLEGMVQTLTDISELVVTHNKLQTETKKTNNLQKYLSSIIDSMPSTLIAVDVNCCVTQWNLKAQETTKLDLKSVEHKALGSVYPFLKEDIDTISKCMVNKQSMVIKNRPWVKTSDTKYFDIRIFPLTIDAIIGAVIIIEDVSTQFKLQEQFVMAQKMDAVGQLSGGIAHDFNNMLGGILGAAELLSLNKSNTSESNADYLGIIIDTTVKASDLTSKLLSFSRKKHLQKSVINIHEVINDALSITQRTTDRIISFNTKLDANNTILNGDFTALQSVLLNLILNASYAIKSSGEILIQTKNVDLSQEFCNESIFSIKPGTYINLVIKDTGDGISPENITKVFEPFFTTKPQGEGTGLGLSSVYGTILDHLGAIKVSSQLNIGTEFQILLPCTQDNPKEQLDTHNLQTFSGLVLVVDDEEIIRLTVKSMLEKMGFEVITASNGLEAIEIFQKQHQNIVLCILDMIMPELNGKDTYYKLNQINSDCPVIISSGFTRDENLDALFEDGLSGFINKPYLYKDLNKAISQVKMT